MRRLAFSGCAFTAARRWGSASAYLPSRSSCSASGRGSASWGFSVRGGEGVGVCSCSARRGSVSHSSASRRSATVRPSVCSAVASSDLPCWVATCWKPSVSHTGARAPSRQTLMAYSKLLCSGARLQRTVITNSAPHARASCPRRAGVGLASCSALSPRCWANCSAIGCVGLYHSTRALRSSCKKGVRCGLRSIFGS